MRKEDNFIRSRESNKVVSGFLYNPLLSDN